ncbi:MAG: hypothetical protein HYZ53_02600 [Planctomycetes bacterium]|nr:hypothetical protein [Planctomycetota bacterium]
MKPSLQDLLDRAMRDVGLTPRRVNLTPPAPPAPARRAPRPAAAKHAGRNGRASKAGR